METTKLQASESSHQRINETNGANGKVGANTQADNAAKMEGVETPQKLFANAVNGVQEDARTLWENLAPRVYARIVRHYAKRVIKRGKVDEETRGIFAKIFENCEDVTNGFTVIVKTATDENGNRFLSRENCKTLCDCVSSFRNAKTIVNKIAEVKRIEEEQRAARLKKIHDLRALISYAKSLPQEVSAVFKICETVVFPVPNTDGVNLTYNLYNRICK